MKILRANSNDPKDYSYLFPKIKQLNHHIIQSQSLREFEKALTDHEELLAPVLEDEPIKYKAFRDFPGALKSLGSWGGDFLLVTWEDTKEELKNYLNQNNMNILFSWNELVKHSNHG